MRGTGRHPCSTDELTKRTPLSTIPLKHQYEIKRRMFNIIWLSLLLDMNFITALLHYMWILHEVYHERVSAYCHDPQYRAITVGGRLCLASTRGTADDSSAPQNSWLSAPHQSTNMRLKGGCHEYEINPDRPCVQRPGMSTPSENCNHCKFVGLTSTYILELFSTTRLPLSSIVCCGDIMGSPKITRVLKSEAMAGYSEVSGDTWQDFNPCQHHGFIFCPAQLDLLFIIYLSCWALLNVFNRMNCTMF